MRGRYSIGVVCFIAGCHNSTSPKSSVEHAATKSQPALVESCCSLLRVDASGAREVWNAGSRVEAYQVVSGTPVDLRIHADGSFQSYRRYLPDSDQVAVGMLADPEPDFTVAITGSSARIAFQGRECSRTVSGVGCAEYGQPETFSALLHCDVIGKSAACGPAHPKE